ncbi:MAG TPA: class I SAM-dependent methyltransferase [Noviherbaspirillum sp.]|nr:class I SAM-dependent methyltransferase [Noviherbaspirillum sp.]
MAGDCNALLASPTRRRILSLGAAALAAGLAHVPCRAQAMAPFGLDVPYDPSPPDVVERMLALAAVGRDDLLYDLGSGDGRIVITAAQKYGVRGVGIDLDPRRVEEAKANAKRAGVEGRVTFRVGDMYTADFSDATVVTLFLWPHVNRKLRPILWRQLKVGTRVVSHLWDMGPEWPPERSETVRDRKIHLWTITDAQKR